MEVLIKKICLVLALVMIAALPAVSAEGAEQWPAVGERGFSDNPVVADDAQPQKTSVSLIVYQGIPYVAYQEDDPGVAGSRIMVSKYENKMWQQVGNPVDTLLDDPSSVSLCVDQGNLYVAYRKDNFYVAVKKHNEVTGNWDICDNDIALAYDHTSISLFKSYVAFYENSVILNVLPYVWDENSWSFLGIVPSGVLSSISLFVDGNTLYLACQDSALDVKVYRYVPPGWVDESPGGLPAGGYSSVSLHVYAATPYVAYQESVTNDIRVSYKDGAGDWQVLGGTSVGQGIANSSISLSVNGGTPYVAYQQATDPITGDRNIVTKKYDNGIWQQVGENVGSVANYSTVSLFVNPETPYVAYADFLGDPSDDNKITVKYYPTYTVTYDGNGSTGGSVPVDGSAYAQGEEVTVLGNTRGLVRTGHNFAGWNTAADGSGTDYAADDTFNMGPANVTLYARWTLIPAGNGGGGGTIDPVVTVPGPVVVVPEGAFVARWPGHMPLVEAATLFANPGASFIVPAPGRDKLAAAKAKGLEQRIYYWNEKFEKWVALASYPQYDGSVLVRNDGAYANIHIAMFSVRQPRFMDISGHWSEDVINRMNGLALLEGYPVPAEPDSLNRLAGPDRKITRAEFTAILARLLGCLPEDEKKLYGVLLPQGQETDMILAGMKGIPDWARDFVAGAVSSGLATGRTSGDFAGDAVITRIEAAVMISNMIHRLPGYNPDDLSHFKDFADIPDWAKGLISGEVLTGYPDGTIQPNAPISRAEALGIILKLLRALGW